MREEVAPVVPSSLPEARLGAILGGRRLSFPEGLRSCSQEMERTMRAEEVGGGTREGY